MSRHIDKLRLRVRSLIRSGAVEQDLSRELRAHIDEETAANVAAGMTPEDARRAAVTAFGSIPSVEEQCRDVRRVRWLENLVRDLRYAVRMFAQRPGLLLTAATSIALGVGANLTIFSLGNNLLLSTPTADRADELVMIRTSNGSHVSYRGWRQLEAGGVLSGLAGYQFEQNINWRNGDESVALIPMLVTANFFDVVRVPFERGRGFSGR